MVEEGQNVTAMCPVCVDERYCVVVDVAEGVEVVCLSCGEDFEPDEIYEE